MIDSAPPPSRTVEEVPIKDLRPDPANSRRISDDERGALTPSLPEFGFVRPVPARHDDGIVAVAHEVMP